MSEHIPGIHHVTAVAGDAQRNLDFYAGTLGLRLVKRTVNFDDPGTYHFYFGDQHGRPGSLVTFFPWSGIGRGKPGTGEVSATAFAVAPGAHAFWKPRLDEAGASPVVAAPRFGEAVLAFVDPDGMPVELIETPLASGVVPPASDVPATHAIAGLHSATLHLRSSERTGTLLERLGFARVGEESGRTRFRADGGAIGSVVDTVESPGVRHGDLGAGSVHHIAFRTRDEASQADWLVRLQQLELRVTPVQDRQYFHSIYFREPGGVLFEIATDPPGFATDEPLDRLGEGLQLPEWLEPMRARIERTLPPLERPHAADPRR
jgi:glyoxalase family protein